MAVRCEHEDREMTLWLSGEVDHHRAREMMEEMDWQIETWMPRSLTVEMSGVTFMDSSGIAVLLRAYRRLRELGGAVRVSGVPAQAAKVLRAAGLQKMMTIEE